MKSVELFGCLISPKILRCCVQYVGEHCRDGKEFLWSFVRVFFFKWAIIFLQDFLVVHCCKGVALIYSAPIQKTPFIKKYHNFSSNMHNINSVFTGVFNCWCVACKNVERAAYSQLRLHITGEYNRQQAGISC